MSKVYSADVCRAPRVVSGLVVDGVSRGELRRKVLRVVESDGSAFRD